MLIERPLHAARCGLSHGRNQSRQREESLGGRVGRAAGDASCHRRRGCSPVRGAVGSRHSCGSSLGALKAVHSSPLTFGCLV